MDTYIPSSNAQKLIKQSYTVPCSSMFRNKVLELAEQRQVNAADLARSILLVVDPDDIHAAADPGEPHAEDREVVVLKSGPSSGRPWRRKPRLQLRLMPGLDVVFIRKSLGLALALQEGTENLRLMSRMPEPVAPQGSEQLIPISDLQKALAEIEQQTTLRIEGARRETKEELDRLRAMVSVLSFEPLPHGISSRAEALHVMGFPPSATPQPRDIKARFRMLATIHHPDNVYGSHNRMSQLNAAMEFLRR
jgi:hypothetical protein